MASIPWAGSVTLRSSTLPQIVSRECLNQKRSFASTLRRSKGGGQKLDLVKLAPKQQHAGTRMKNLKKDEVPTDMGMIPQTFIRPAWSEGPSLFSSGFIERIIIDYITVKQSFKDFLGKYMIYRWPTKDIATGKRRVFPLWFKERSSVAQKLHTRLYTAIASGDRATIKDIACTGLIQQQLSRLDRRDIAEQPNQVWQVKYSGWVPSPRIPWTIQMLLPFKAIKVVSDRQMDLPFGTACSVRQYIVRIKSKQTIKEQDGSNAVTKKLTEYMVVQRIILDYEPDKWMVWGTTKPSTFEDAQEIRDPKLAEARRTQRSSLWDRVKLDMNSKMGTNL